MADAFSCQGMGTQGSVGYEGAHEQATFLRVESFLSLALGYILRGRHPVPTACVHLETQALKSSGVVKALSIKLTS